MISTKGRTCIEKTTAKSGCIIKCKNSATFDCDTNLTNGSRESQWCSSVLVRPRWNNSNPRREMIRLKKTKDFSGGSKRLRGTRMYFLANGCHGRREIEESSKLVEVTLPKFSGVLSMKRRYVLVGWDGVDWGNLRFALEEGRTSTVSLSYY